MSAFKLVANNSLVRALVICHSRFQERLRFHALCSKLYVRRIKTYADFAETCGGMVLANEMANRPLEPVSGDYAPWDEVFQWYIISDPSFAMEHSDELIFYDEELDLYLLAVTHFGTAWDCVPAPELH